MGLIPPSSSKVLPEQGPEQKRLPAATDARHDLYQTILLTPDNFVQIVVAPELSFP